MRRLLSSGAVALVLGLAAAPSASAQQSVNIFVGGFIPRGDQLASGNISGRSSDDVLTANASCTSQFNCPTFGLNDFNSVTVGGEWLVGLGNNFEAGLGVGYYGKTVPTVNALLTNANGSEIEEDLRLRVVPFTATVRFLPLGRRGGIQPYVGAGVGVFAWKYSESGQFVDSSDSSIFSGTFQGSGTATGPVILGGARVPVGGFDVGFEARYQSAQGNLPADQGFAGSKIDLGGMNYLFTMNFRF